jgi:hypothetical protein
MIRRVLYLLFNVDDIPKYKTRPDLKDTEYTLGYFCEQIIRNKELLFTRESFIKDLNSFCEDNVIELDIHVIFDVLFENNIIVMRGVHFCFKFTYWIYYFSAHRMLQSQSFADYIFTNSNYVSYPEIIEFYTGIDRRRNDALNVMISDLDSINKLVESKCSFPNDFNIYDKAKWLPTDEQLVGMLEEVAQTVSASGLPDELKDEYADRSYNRSRPLHQSFEDIIEDYALLKLFKCIKASSSALRNSDYASKELKEKLLRLIFESWSLFNKVLIALSPLLAKQGQARVDGMSFYITDEDFNGSIEQKLNGLISAFPSNVCIWFVDELFSKKMGPLIKNSIKDFDEKLIQHYLHILLINKKPSGWETFIEKYIIDEDKNSYYLNDIFRCLKAEYKYSFTSNKNLALLRDLIKMTAAKHQLGLKKPSQKHIKNLPDNVVPKRQV